MLILVFSSSILLTQNRYDTKVETLVDYEKKADIVFFSSWAGYDTKADAVSDLLARFQEEHEEINVVNKSTGGDDFLFSLKADFASGKDPDVFGLWPGSDIELLINRGKVQPLDALLKSDAQWQESFGELGWDLVSHDGLIYGIPYEIIYEGMFVNKEIFEALNLKIPETFEELKYAVSVIGDNGYIPIAYNATPEGSFIYQNMVISLGGKEQVSEPFDSEGHIQQAFIDGMYAMRELYELGAFPIGYIGISDYERDQLFVEKKAAMIVQGSWLVGDNKVKPESVDVSVVPIPRFKNSLSGPRAITYGLGNGVFYISTTAWNNEEKKDLSVELLKELTSVETALQLVNENGSQINVKLSEALVDAPNMYYEGRKLVSTATDRVGPVDSYIDRIVWEDLIIERFPQMLRGEIEPEDIFKDAESAYKKNQNKVDGK